MRKFLALSIPLLLAGCMARPPQAVTTPAPVPQPEPEEQTSLSGLTAQELVGRLGAPTLQIREGNSLKLQFRSARCVLDAYLYPSGGSGAYKVTHVDTRLPSGGDIGQAACLFAFRSAQS